MKTPLHLFLATLALYTLTAGGHLYSPDEEVMFRTAASLATGRGLAIEPIAGGFATSRGPDGRQYAQYGIGQPLLSVPFYWAGRALAAALPEALPEADWAHIYGIEPGTPREALFFDPTPANIAPRFAVSFFNIVLSALFAVVVWRIALQLTGHRGAALLSALAYALGSMAWAHSRPYFSEAGAAFFMAVAWTLVLDLRGARRPLLVAALAGAATGFAALVRMDSVLMYPGLALALVDPRLWDGADRARTNTDSARTGTDGHGRETEERGKSDREWRTALRDYFSPRLWPWKIWLAFCAPAAACGGVLLLLNVIRYGGPFATGYSDQPEGVEFLTPALHGLYGFLFSVGKGMFFFSPALALSFLGWGALARRGRWTCAAIAVSVVIPLLAMSKWQNWAGGWCWGPRHIFMIHFFLAAPIAAWLADGWGVVRRMLAAVALAVGVGVNLLGVSQDFIKFHQIFYRDPELHYHVLYDHFDESYWGQYYALYSRRSPEEQPRPARFGEMPAPIQHSLFIPQSSVWEGYPIMLKRLHLIDNVWLRLARGEPNAPGAAQQR